MDAKSNDAYRVPEAGNFGSIPTNMDYQVWAITQFILPPPKKGGDLESKGVKWKQDSPSS